MLILLPPSETKTARPRGRATDLASLSFPELTSARSQVLAALVEASAQPDAAKRLRIPDTLGEALMHNLEVWDSPATPVGEFYTGVLYDALDLPGLTGPARRRANQWLVVVSAAWGAVRMTDRVGAYRVAMDVDLPPLGKLSTWWRPRLDAALTPAAGSGLVVDCRSAAYGAAWQPTGAVADKWVQVKVPGASHWAKHTRGLVARWLCLHGTRARTPMSLAEDLSADFHVELGTPARAGAPWQLDVTARG